MTGTAKWLMVACALAVNAASADDPAPSANVLGVRLALDENGKPAAVDDATRRQLVENLRASFAALGVNAQSGPLEVSPQGVESMRIGLERTAISVARVNANGDLEMLCVHGEEKAAEFLAGASEQ